MARKKRRPVNMNKYIESNEWNEKKALYYNKYKSECSMCSSKKNLHIHHVTYKRLGNENIETDLVCLCKECHFKIHDHLRANRIKISETKVLLNLRKLK